MNTQEPMMLSGIQHFSICRRQWALIHIEQQWSENELTTDGLLLHKRAHDDRLTESRDDLLVTRGLHIRSEKLNVTGICDVVEFHRTSEGITLPGREGRWTVFPVEYKRGSPKENDADRLQLCGQAICLEEMLLCRIPEGSLYYGEIRHRENVHFTKELRDQVEKMLKEMHQYFDRGYTPKAKVNPNCRSCSLKDLCLPKLEKVTSVKKYLSDALEDTPE